jgi:hypothetical protein
VITLNLGAAVIARPSLAEVANQPGPTRRVAPPLDTVLVEFKLCFKYIPACTGEPVPSGLFNLTPEIHLGF